VGRTGGTVMVINVRLSASEYRTAQSFSEDCGFGSLSDLFRTAMHIALENRLLPSPFEPRPGSRDRPGANPIQTLIHYHALARQLASIDGKLANLELLMRRSELESQGAAARKRADAP